jgi:sulfoxide reductase heme-binding subunit YedZ
MTILATATGSHVFWITSRAAGLVALILASASVGVGVSMGGRMFRGRGPELKVIHEALSIATLAAVALHALALLGDAYFHPTIADLTIPFSSGYRQPYMALGIIAGWGFVTLGLSFYARTRIGIARWRILHRFTALAWILGVVHALGEGTDSGQAWFLAITAIAVIPPLALVCARLVRPRRKAGAAGAARPARPARPARAS